MIILRALRTTERTMVFHFLERERTPHKFLLTRRRGEDAAGD